MPDFINLSTINERLGYQLRTDFITDTLRVASSGKDKRSTLWTEDAFVEICERLNEHNARVASGDHQQAREVSPRTPKVKPAGKTPVADPFADDDSDPL